MMEIHDEKQKQGQNRCPWGDAFLGTLGLSYSDSARDGIRVRLRVGVRVQVADWDLGWGEG